MDKYETLLQQIIPIARKAGEIILSASEIEEHVHSKEGHGNFVTEYDEKVQEYLLGELAKLLPEAHFVGEEEGKEVFLEEYKKGYTFVIDPIDGTSNFMKAYRPSVTSIALLKDGKPFIGVIYNPYSDDLFYAERGKGAFRNGRQMFSSEAPLSESLVTMGTAPYYGSKVSRAAFEIGFYYLEKSIDIRRSGSACWDLCMVAAGVNGIFFEPRLCLWDYAAGACIVMEAGGRVTDFEGKDLSFDGKAPVIAAGRGVIKEDYLPPKELISF
ncbi:MAG: inositol monophosphatase [Blautia sp.]|nr:inositol monophosphatase [Blautia sp.]